MIIVQGVHTAHSTTKILHVNNVALKYKIHETSNKTMNFKSIFSLKITEIRLRFLASHQSIFDNWAWDSNVR